MTYVEALWEYESLGQQHIMDNAELERFRWLEKWLARQKEQSETTYEWDVVR